MKYKIIPFIILLLLNSLVSFSQKRTDFNDRPLTGTVTGYIHNPNYTGTNYVNIHDNYSIGVNEIVTTQNPKSVLASSTITLGTNISEAVVTFGKAASDSFSYTITNIPYYKNFVIILYNKMGNVDEQIIKKDESNYSVTGAFFQNTRTPKWSKDFQYPSMNIKKCIPTNPSVTNDIYVKLSTPVILH